MWLTTARVADLLRGAGVQIAVALTAPERPLRKRPAEVELKLEVHHFNQSTGTAVLEQAPASAGPSLQSHPERSTPLVPADAPLPRPQSHQDPQYGPDFVTAFLGPGYAPTACVAPGYDWWPMVPFTDPTPAPQPQQQYDPTAYPFIVPSQSFTFTPEQLSQDFLQGIRDPVLHFPAPPQAYPPLGR